MDDSQSEDMSDDSVSVGSNDGESGEAGSDWAGSDSKMSGGKKALPRVRVTLWNRLVSVES